MKYFEIVYCSLDRSFFSQTIHCRFKRYLTHWLGVILLLLAVQPGVSWAQTAKNVNCNNCVHNSDIAKETITSNRIKDGTIKRRDIAVDAINSSRIKDGTVKRADIADGAVTINKLSPGAQQALVGPAGPKGPTGDDGADSTVAGADGADGQPGQSCTVARTQADDGVNISCEEGNIASVYDGTTVPGLNPGDMQYWDGTVWVLIPAADTDKTTLHSCAGVPTWGPCPYSIGDTGPAGGMVFYITEGGLHGLEAAPEDQALAKWGCSPTDIPGAEGTAVGTGAQNTTAILNGCAENGIAARIARNYSLNGFVDWYLPSKDELNEMYQNIGSEGGFTWNRQWSSTEIGGGSAWVQYVNNGGQGGGSGIGKSSPQGVRPVRAF
jgi:hypothetical protein